MKPLPDTAWAVAGSAKTLNYHCHTTPGPLPEPSVVPGVLAGCRLPLPGCRRSSASPARRIERSHAHSAKTHGRHSVPTTFAVIGALHRAGQATEASAAALDVASDASRSRPSTPASDGGRAMPPDAHDGQNNTPARRDPASIARSRSGGRNGE
jgi:hypothetical protein